MLLIASELAEILIYEFRLTKILSRPDSSDLSMEITKMDLEGNETTVTTEHWAVATREKFKNRRTKLMEILSKNKPQEHNTSDTGLAGQMSALLGKINSIMAQHRAEEANSRRYDDVTQRILS